MLREIIASYVVTVDDKPLTALDRKINKFEDKMKHMATVGIAAFGTVAYGMYELVEAAAQAEEMMNVLGVVFGDNKQQVVDWSQATAKAMSRSYTDIQKTVGLIGAVLKPQFVGTDVDVALMAETLTQRSIDLASLYNTSDEEAMERIKSGMMGETEAVRRLGIDISDNSLNELNKKTAGSSQHKLYGALSMKEKTLLRYKQILLQSTDAEGDAVRTGNTWTASMKRVNAKLKDTTVELGKKLMPAAMKFAQWVEKIIDKSDAVVEFFDLLINRTYAAEAAFKAASLAASAFALKAAGPALNGLLNTAVKSGGGVVGASAVDVAASAGGTRAILAGLGVASYAAIAGLALLAEDLFAFSKGAKSITGDTITAWTGINDPLTAVTNSLEEFALLIDKVYYYLSQTARVLKIVSMLVPGINLLALALGVDPIAEAAKISSGEGAPPSFEEYRKQRSDAKKSEYRQALEGGDLQGAIKAAKIAFDMDSEGAVAQVSKDRKAYLLKNPTAISPTDRLHGFDPYTGSGQSGQGPLAPPPNMSPPPSIEAPKKPAFADVKVPMWSEQTFTPNVPADYGRFTPATTNQSDPSAATIENMTVYIYNPASGHETAGKVAAHLSRGVARGSTPSAATP